MPGCSRTILEHNIARGNGGEKNSFSFSRLTTKVDKILYCPGGYWPGLSEKYVFKKTELF
jgi:hypothetical protein